MDAITLLTHRQSHPRLIEPAPTGDALENIMISAVRAPDHACLAPWQFFICEGEGLDRLGQLFVDSAKANNREQKDVERAAKLPHRAPMVIVTAMKYTFHEKVPRVEQLASAACATMAMQMAAQAQGFNGMWRTGSYAQCDIVKQGFGLAADDELVGFLYLGTPQTKAGIKPARNIQNYFSRF
ncbi:NAD(P)H nitroreductase [Alteromonas sediminis]|uniref:Putative NAD(P)H nitroreductase n=1 Tax=Alteromonas sediminis TaxID=2259342 RepID=A0A3N5ZBL0_9ALTE|nr:NAD(P)H nitroreductase [Alteromonas sediminis]RPJ68744.1 NAD(P)H nitroreductase [Alteromonas sediminis]